jgi:LPS O-antigen subunit length determinant protein (WzzB/FepE family)
MSEMNVREDEINLYDYWKLIVKRKILIIGLFLVAVLASAIISFLTPKIYRGEVVLKLPAITAKELLSVIGKIDAERIKNFLPTTHHLITDIKLNALKDSTDKLQLIIEAKNTDAIPSAITEFAAYLNNFSLIKRATEEDRQRLLKQSEELSNVIKEANELAQTYKKLLKEGKLIPLNFNPVEIKKKASDMEVERFAIEQALKRPKGVEMIENPHILKNPVKPSIKKNIALAGIVSLLIGIFLAFFMEYVERIRNKSE